MPLQCLSRRASYVTVVFCLALVGCTPSEIVSTIINELDVVEITGIVETRSGEPIENVTVRAPLGDRIFQDETDSVGSFTLLLPNDELPRNFLLLFYKEGFVPVGKNYSRSGSRRLEVNVDIEETRPNQVFADGFLNLVHLGDDSYSGSINSQFQKRTDGLTHTTFFDIPLELMSYQSVTLSILAKGLQVENELIINDTLVAYLDSSAETGAFTRVIFEPFETQALLRSGRNTLRINSVFAGGTYDDFEFTNIMFEFEN
ncbi:MAG: hypothetical protein AAF267_24615 [Deinococcota bacterium]